MEKDSVGNHYKEVDFEELEKLVEMQCTLEEIASFFDVHKMTIKRRIKEEYDMDFVTYKELKGTKGRIHLRRLQWKSANKGSVDMQKWLGKNMLDQTEKSEIKEIGKKVINVKFVDEIDDE